MNEQNELIVKLENLEAHQSSAKDRAANIAAGVAGGLAGAVGAVVASLAGSSVKRNNEIKKVEFSEGYANSDINTLIKKRVQSI